MVHGAFWGPYYSPSSKTTTPAPTEMAIEVEQSSGFHVFELHAPTAGVSFFAIVCALIAVGLAYGCYKRCCFGRLFAGVPNQAPIAPQYIPMQLMPPTVQQTQSSLYFR